MSTWDLYARDAKRSERQSADPAPTMVQSRFTPSLLSSPKPPRRSVGVPH